MYIVNSYFTVALALAVIGGIILAILHWYNLAAAKNRMKRMMVSCGIDEEIAEKADQLLKVDMVAVRSRCRHCPVTYLCDRWLDGHAIASNGFCPNARIFVQAADSSQS
jgi:hypothetical protein